MFKFLKDKLKKTVSALTDKIDKEATEEIVENEIEKVEIKEEDSPLLITESDVQVEKPNKAPEHVEAKPHEPKELKQTHSPEQPREEVAGFFSRLKGKLFSTKDEDKDLVDITHKPTEKEEIKEVRIKQREIEEKGWVKEARLKDEVLSKVIEGITPSVKDVVDLHAAKELTKEEQIQKAPEEVIKDEPKVVELPEGLAKDEAEEITAEPEEIRSAPRVEELSFGEPEFIKPKEPLEVPVEEEKTSFFGKIKQSITTKKIDEKQFEDLFWDLEIALLENNVAVEVIDKIKLDLKEALIDKPIPRSKISSTINSTLSQSISSLFNIPTFDLLTRIREAKPYVICFVGINGSGKTTTIAKVCQLLKDNKISSVLAASDTFRAAAIDQLQLHATKLGVKLVKHDYGSDPAAVAFDAIDYAKAHNIDVVLIDTAGRIHSNENLMAEMEKIVRVAQPHLKLFIGESITGNDCVEQAKKFNEAINIDGIILSKLDVDDKGGAAISVGHVTGKPIIFYGTGQDYRDLKPFNPEDIIKSVGLES